MNRLAVLGIVFFILSAALFVFTLLSAPKLDRYFESIRQNELKEKHQAVAVFAASKLSSGTLLLRTMLDERVVSDKELKPNSVRSLHDAFDRTLLRSLEPGQMLMEDDLGPVEKELQQ
jgi:flagella basal body P-ring formation protein FlgA